MWRQYSGFTAVCTIIGLAYAAYSAATATGLLPLLRDASAGFMTVDRTAERLLFVATALIVAAIVAGPLALIATVLGISIKEPEPAPDADEVAEIRKRS